MVAFYLYDFYFSVSPSFLLCLGDKFIKFITYICPSSKKADIKFTFNIRSAFPKQLASKLNPKINLGFYRYIAILGSI